MLEVARSLLDALFGPMHSASPELSAMIDAARAAGVGLMRHFHARSKLRIELKGPADFVSSADLESERTLQAMLLGAFPSFGFVAEESPAVVGSDPGRRFIVDPLDGTTNFVSGIPHFAISIGYQREHRIVAGVVFDPAKSEMFVAEEGGGAWRLALQGTDGLVGSDAEALRVSPDPDFSRALVATGIPHASRLEAHAAYLPMLASVMREAAGIRRFAAAALDLAYVAAGRFAAYFERGLSAWDIAAGSILVREAGGLVTDLIGGGDFLKSGDVLATNGHLHEPMRTLLQQAAFAVG